MRDLRDGCCDDILCMQMVIQFILLSLCFSVPLTSDQDELTMSRAMRNMQRLSENQTKN